MGAVGVPAAEAMVEAAGAEEEEEDLPPVHHKAWGLRALDEGSGMKIRL